MRAVHGVGQEGRAGTSGGEQRLAAPHLRPEGEAVGGRVQRGHHGLDLIGRPEEAGESERVALLGSQSESESCGVSRAIHVAGLLEPVTPQPGSGCYKFTRRGMDTCLDSRLPAARTISSCASNVFVSTN